MFGKEVLLSATQVEKMNSLVPAKFKKDNWQFITDNIDKIPRTKSDIAKMLGV